MCIIIIIIIIIIAYYLSFCMRDAALCCVNVGELRTPSDTTNFTVTQYFVLNTQHVSAVMGRRHLLYWRTRIRLTGKHTVWAECKNWPYVRLVTTGLALKGSPVMRER